MAVARSSPTWGEPLQELAGPGRLPVGGQPDAQAELGVVLEQRVGPGRPPLRPSRPGGGGRVAAVDRGAAGGVGDQQPVAEQLADQLEVLGLAAAAAGPENSNSGWRTWEPLTVSGPSVAVQLGDPEEEVPALQLALQELIHRGHVDRLVLDLLLGMGRADLDADPAAGAVVGRMDGASSRAGRGSGNLGLEARRGALQGLGAEHLHADGRRARRCPGALAAVDADRRVPDGDLGGQRALLPWPCRSGRPRPRAGR